MKLKSWDGNNINDGTNYVSVLNANFYGLPGIEASLGMRHGSWPILGGVERRGRELNFEIYIRSGTSLELEQWFDPEDETAKQLIAEDGAGGNDRFVNAICTELREVPFGAGLHYAVSLQIDGDVRWRETSITTASAWSVTATGQTKVVDNNGQDKAYPIIKIEPTSAKSVGFDYKRFIAVQWDSVNSSTNYPMDIVNNGFDTATLTTAKMQADGDDLRVWVDGVEVDRWLQDMDDATTQVWVNLDFQGDENLRRLGEDMTIDQDYIILLADGHENIEELSSSGIVKVGSEIITYTGKNNQELKLTGCTRGAKGTTAATHVTNAFSFWLQHDIWIYYGDSTLSAPTVDDDYKPAFLLSSTNASWDYDNFGDDGGKRSAAWIFSGNAKYTGNQFTFTSPWSEMGIWAIGTDTGLWKLINPCGITNFNFANGEKKITDYPLNYDAKVKSWNGSVWVDEYIIPDPSSADTWEAWNYDAAPDSGTIGAGLWLKFSDSVEWSWVEVSDVTLTIGDQPQTAIGSELANYPLSCTITNNTTGDAIEITFDMLLNEELEVDTDDKTAIYLKYNSNQFNALDLSGGPRANWLPLDVGNNTLQLDDIGTGDLTITVTWWERYYE